MDVFWFVSAITTAILGLILLYTFLVVVPRTQRKWTEFYDRTGVWPGADAWPNRKPNRPPKNVREL